MPPPTGARFLLFGACFNLSVSWWGESSRPTQHCSVITWAGLEPAPTGWRNLSGSPPIVGRADPGAPMPGRENRLSQRRSKGQGHSLSRLRRQFLVCRLGQSAGQAPPAPCAPLRGSQRTLRSKAGRMISAYGEILHRRKYRFDMACSALHTWADEDIGPYGEMPYRGLYRFDRACSTLQVFSASGSSRPTQHISTCVPSF